MSLSRLFPALSAAVALLAATPFTAQAQDGYEDLGRPMLGVVMTPPSNNDLRKNDVDKSTGVVIRRVYGGSSAEEMGLEYGDLITEVNGVKIDSMSKLRKIIQSYQPGDEVRVEGLRGGEPIESDGFLGGWPDNIPFRDIDRMSEERYRNRVARQSARREQTLDRLRQQQQALDDEIQQLREDEAAPAASKPTTPPGHGCHWLTVVGQPPGG